MAGLVASEVDKNFANPDCGAKVIEANVESLNAEDLIKSTPDAYIMNECTVKPWFIVELCNHIYANKVAIAREQLYSGTFKRVNISISVTYPRRRSTDWFHFGEFEAENVRGSQVFENANGVFGKYVKVEIMGNFDEGYTYCAISQFKIYGISETEKHMPIIDGNKEKPEGPWDEVKHKIAMMELTIANLQNTIGNLQNDVSSLENLAERSYEELKVLKRNDIFIKLSQYPKRYTELIFGGYWLFGSLVIGTIIFLKCVC